MNNNLKVKKLEKGYVFSQMNLQPLSINITGQSETMESNVNKIMNEIKSFVTEPMDKKEREIQLKYMRRHGTIRQKPQRLQASKKNIHGTYKMLPNFNFMKEIKNAKKAKRKDINKSVQARILKRIGMQTEGVVDQLMSKRESGFDANKFFGINMYQILNPGLSIYTKRKSMSIFEKIHEENVIDKEKENFKIDLDINSPLIDSINKQMGKKKLKLFNSKEFDKLKQYKKRIFSQDFNYNYPLPIIQDKFTETMKTDKTDKFEILDNTMNNKSIRGSLTNEDFMTFRTHTNVKSNKLSQLEAALNKYVPIPNSTRSKVNIVENNFLNGTRSSLMKVKKTKFESTFTENISPARTEYSRNNASFGKKFHNKIFSSFDLLQGRLEEINKTLKMDKAVTEENLKKEYMKLQREKVPEMNSLKVEEKQRYAYIYGAKPEKKSYMKIGMMNKFVNAVELGDRLNILNSNSAYKFSDVLPKD